jgi:hypothetical protein
MGSLGREYAVTEADRQVALTRYRRLLREMLDGDSAADEHEADPDERDSHDA